MPKRKAKTGGARKKMGTGLQRRLPVKGGPIAPNPASLLGAGASIARGMLGGQKQVVGEWLRNTGETSLSTTARIGREEYDRQKGVLPKGSVKFMPDTSKPPTMVGKKKRGGAGTARTM